jgi:diguanylate cyclase (GGDEF)-like protein
LPAATLQGESVAARVALDEQASRVRRALTGAVALRAVSGVGSPRDLERLGATVGLDYVVIAQEGSVAGAAVRPAPFAAVRVTPQLLAGSSARAGLVTDRHISVLGKGGGDVWGGLYRDERFLATMWAPVATVADGRAVLSSTEAPGLDSLRVAAPARGAFAAGEGWRGGFCVCSGASPSGVLVLARWQSVGVFPPLHGPTLAVVLVAVLAGLALGFGLAKMVSQPIQRLADDTVASLRDELDLLREELDEWDAEELTRLDHGREDEVSRIGEAFRALRTGLRHAADELGGSREELRRARDRLSDQERISLSDSLTGVWNRRYLDIAVADAMQRGRRLGHSFSIFMIDIDRFKLVNDRLGHQHGDEVLVELCRRIPAGLRAHFDVLVRFGGEEFVVVLPETGPAGALVVAQKIRHLVRSEPFAVGPGPLEVTVSIGVASFAADGSDADQVLAAADANMYRAKRAGRDRVTAG